MVHYLFKVLILVVFSAFIIFSYYYWNPSHIESFDWYLPYIIVMIFSYGAYKTIQVLFTQENGKVQFNPLIVFSFFLFHLFILCSLFFYMNGNPLIWGFILFFKILFFSFLPFSIIIISTAFWKKVLSMLFARYNFLQFLREEKVFFLLGGIGVWFFSFLFFIACFWVLWFYNLWVLFAILIWFSYFARRELLDIIISFVDTKYSFEVKEGSYFHLLSVEFLFLIAAFLLSVNLISIVRPFPIGWDDLGIYMNNPHLFADAKSLVAFWGMYAWQTFTWIWYLFGSATQAFFFNVVWSFLSFFVLTYIVSDLLRSVKKTFINIPLLVGTLFISLPMIVFQQAKDMKLDSGLFFVSIIVVYLLYKVYILFWDTQKNDWECIESKKEEVKITTPNNNGLFISLFLVIWILAWFAFTIKFTSLLLISAIIGVIFFASFGVLAFLWYILIFFSIFTIGDLWSYMNVIVNPTNIPNFEIIFSLISGSIWFLLFVLSIRFSQKNQWVDHIKKFFVQLGVFLLGVFITLIPWVGKNIVVSYPDISIGTMLSGKSDSFQLDTTKIYSEDELKIKKESIKSRSLSSTGTTADEDLWRYFGYDKGINNYVRLPWNLTMQTNQWWEFTNIWFFFLALLPVVLLFLPYRRKYMGYGVLLLLALEVWVFRFDFLSSFLSNLSLPLWYAVILWFFLLPLIYFLYALDSSKKFIRLFQLNLIFATFYTFLWTISAFGIVWYGIVMYFSLLLMIAISAYYIVSYDKIIDLSSKEFLIKWLGGICFFWVLFTHFSQSVIPHTFTNLKWAGYAKYKLSQINKYEAPFLYHKEYLPMLFELNITPEKRKEFIDTRLVSDAVKEFVSRNNGGEDIAFIVWMLNQLKVSDKLPVEVRKSANKSIYNIYKWISKPEDQYRNREGIYRIGTFLKYHILENNKRLLEDSLIFNFDDYIYNPDPSVTVDNMKKLWLKYLLVDLNAATIDKDARHNLTRRYECLLSTFHSDKLELVDTDSMCLKVALEKYSQDGNLDDYMTFAGINFDSYVVENGVEKKIERWEKLIKCYKYINTLVKTNQITNDSYQYLLPHADYIRTNTGLLDNDNKIHSFLHTQIWKSFKVLFKIKE